LVFLEVLYYRNIPNEFVIVLLNVIDILRLDNILILGLNIYDRLVFLLQQDEGIILSREFTLLHVFAKMGER
jgi:hypothetical protein